VLTHRKMLKLENATASNALDRRLPAPRPAVRSTTRFRFSTAFLTATVAHAGKCQVIQNKGVKILLTATKTRVCMFMQLRNIRAVRTLGGDPREEAR
jgi:hypothetical protein